MKLEPRSQVERKRSSERAADRWAVPLRRSWVTFKAFGFLENQTGDDHRGNAKEVSRRGNPPGAPISAPAKEANDRQLCTTRDKLVTMTVMRRSFSSSIVRDAIMPGTLQPLPIRRGIKLLPERPHLRKIRSIMKAIRAM